MITGGNAGLGLVLCQKFQGVSYSRSNGFDISRDADALARISLDYDVFINNAYDGVLGEPWHEFGQTKLLHSVATTWRDQGKAGHIINIGGVGGEDTAPPFPGWESYNANKKALKHLSQQWTQAFRANQVPFRTSLLTIDRLDTPRGRQTPTWTGNGHDLDDIAAMIAMCVYIQPNTCIGEIQAWVNLDHKQH